jgi:PIN domain nuclease of toxin-antitoxin system
MRLLLDTHAVIWALTNPSELSQTARAAIANPRNEVFVSAVNAWELSIKYHLGKLPEAAQILPVYHASLSKARFLELLISSEHTILAGGLNWNHRDPFDRLLVAQAQSEAMTLVTMDDAITQSGMVPVLW